MLCFDLNDRHTRTVGIVQKSGIGQYDAAFLNLKCKASSNSGPVAQTAAGFVGNALHATATNRSDARPSVPLVVSPSLDAWGGGAETL